MCVYDRYESGYVLYVFFLPYLTDLVWGCEIHFEDDIR